MCIKFMGMIIPYNTILTTGANAAGAPPTQ